MKLLRSLTFFLWSQICGTLLFAGYICMLELVPGSDIDGTIMIGSMSLRPRQVDEIFTFVWHTANLLLQVIILFIYSKKGLFTGKGKVIKAGVFTVISMAVYYIASYSVAFAYALYCWFQIRF